MSTTSRPIGDVCTFVGGGTPTRNVAEYYGGSIPWVTPKDMKTWQVTGAQISITPAGVENSATRMVPPNSVLVVVRSGVLKHTVPVAINRVPVAINQDMKALLCSDEVDPNYLARFVKERSPVILKWVRATTADNFPIDKLKRLEIPLPPLREQQRIAHILDKGDALRSERRTGLAQLDTLIQSIFLDMFGDPLTNPKRWPVRTIGEVTECLDRLRRPVTESDRASGSVPYYGANGQQGWIDSELFDEPLVLVAEDGGYFDSPERGVAYRIDGPSWVNNHAHVLRALAPYVATEFLHRVLRHFNFMPFISGTTRAKLTQGQLNAVQLFVPPSNLQANFGERVGGVEKLKRSAVLSQEKCDTLFASLQHSAFRGEL